VVKRSVTSFAIFAPASQSFSILAINLSNSNKKTAPKLAKGEMSTAD